MSPWRRLSWEVKYRLQRQTDVACSCAYQLRQRMAEHSDYADKVCHSSDNRAIVEISTPRSRSCCPRTSMTSNAVSLKPSLVPSVIQVRPHRRVQEAVMSEQQYTRIILHNTSTTSYHSE